MTVKFWTNFSKKNNSTKVPASGGIENQNVKLKANCSEHDPILLLDGHDFSYTYAFISEWGRYYFVVDVVSVANNLTEYHLTEDVLGTFKAEIGATNAHIVFSTSSYNKQIIDPRIQVMNSRTLYGSADTVHPVVDPNTDGTFLLSVFNTQQYLSDFQVTGCNSGFGVTYQLTRGGMDNLRRWFSDTSVVQAMQDFFNGDPLNGIFSCKWVPYYIGGARKLKCSFIHIGNQRNPDSLAFDDGQCYIIDGFPLIYGSASLDVNIHYRGLVDGTYVYGNDFRAAEPYTCGDLYLPGVGTISLNMKDWIGESKIYVDWEIEVITGNVVYFVRNASDRILHTAGGNLASECPVGRFYSDSRGTASGIQQGISGMAQLVAGAASENPIIAASGGASMLTGIANTVLSTYNRQTSVLGSFGGRSVVYEPYIKHTESCVDTQNFDIPAYINIRGLPCDGVRQISTLTGYVQCEGASVDANANAREKQEINTFLNSGFYYE